MVHTNYCLYKKEFEERQGDEPEIKLELIMSNLGPETEKVLGKQVLIKAMKNMIYKSGTVSVLPKEEPKEDTTTNTNTIVYYVALIEEAGAHLDDATTDDAEGGHTEAHAGGETKQSGEEGDNEKLGSSLDDVVHPLPKRASREFYVCLLCEDNDHALGLFHMELKSFCDSLTEHLQLQKRAHLETQLASWYSTCIEYIPRCIRALSHDLSILLHSILLAKQIVITGPLFDDISKLVRAVSIVDLNPQGSEQGSDEFDDNKDIVGGEDKLVISFPDKTPSASAKTTPTTSAKTTPASSTTVSPSTSASPSPSTSPQTSFMKPPMAHGNSLLPRPSFSNRETNSFCDDWAKKLLEMDPNEPFKLRTVVEDFKLKVIQELNFIRKVIDQGKLSNYALYKAYLILVSNPNCGVLLNLLLKDIANDYTTNEVLEVIQSYINSKQSVTNVPV